MRYTLCLAPDPLLAMFRRWVIDVTYEVARRGDAGGPDLKEQLCGFA